MFWLSAIRVLKFGLKNFWRNIWLSLATTGIMILTIFTIAVLVILNLVGDTALKSLEQKVDVSVYFNSDVTKEQIDPVEERLNSMPEVRETKYISKEEALESFRNKHGDNPLIIASLSELEENPLQPTLVVKARNPEDYDAISSILKDSQYEGLIQNFNYEDNQVIIDKLTKTTKTIEKIGIGVSISFAFIAVLVMFNTIRLTIYTQKEEISIMRLVGASNRFIVAPYILEGIIYGFVATLFSTIILFSFLKYLSPMISNFLENQVDIYKYFNSHFLIIFASELLFGTVLGIFSSMIAIRRYLKV